MHRRRPIAVALAGSLALLSGEAAAAPLHSTGYFIEQAVNCAVIASLYSLLAVAYALIHGVTNRMVLSFGDFAMFGAFYSVYAMLLALSAGLQAGLALAIVFAVALAGTAALGFAAHRAAFASLIGQPSQALMIASVGVSIVISETMRIQSGGREQWLMPYGGEPLLAGAIGGYPLQLSAKQIVIPAGAALLCGGLLAVMARTPFGRAWRACCEDRGLAALSGLNVDRIIAGSMLLAAMFAAAAGYIIAVHYGGVSFYMGLVLGLKALFATIIGGTGTIAGALLGGILLAALETSWSALFSIEYRDVAVFGVVILVFILRPGGLLGVEIRRDYE